MTARFFSRDAATTEIYTLSLHDALPIFRQAPYFDGMPPQPGPISDITNARVLAVLADSITTDHISPAGSVVMLRSEEHTSELQSQFHLVCRLLLEKKNTMEGPTFWLSSS